VSVYQFYSEGRRAFKHSNPVGPPRTFWRTGDGGVDLFGIERAANHQRLGDGEDRRAMMDDEHIRFLCTKPKMGIDRGFRDAIQAGRPQVCLDGQIQPLSLTNISYSYSVESQRFQPI
jgi:hypothetical protein